MPGPCFPGLLRATSAGCPGRWVPGRTLNGDEVMISYDMAANAAAHRTGTGLKFMADPAIQRVRLYRFQ